MAEQLVSAKHPICIYITYTNSGTYLPWINYVHAWLRQNDQPDIVKNKPRYRHDA